MILAADVGGTKTLVGLFRLQADRLRCVESKSFPSRDYPSLHGIMLEFLEGAKHGSLKAIRGAAVGVAGPVVAGRTHVVNLRWPVDHKRLATKLGLPSVAVINDLEATAWGIPELPSSKFASLTPKLRSGNGNAALIAAGTGLGMALLVRDGKRYQPQASEGGHQAFGPRDDLEIELLQYLREKYGRVSTERAVSGPAFSAIYQFLVESRRGKESAAMSRAFAEEKDPNKVVSMMGMSGKDALAEKAVDLFVSLYGSAAGDLALVAKATGGVYVGGGIAPKILPKLRSGDFVRSFQSKGRLSPVLEKIPVRVILEPRAALIGAAACAARSK